MLPSRAWELLVGVIIALRDKQLRDLVSDLQAAIIGNLSLLILIAALVLLPKGVVWPGAFTLVPVIATAGVLSYGSKT